MVLVVVVAKSPMSSHLSPLVLQTNYHTAVVVVDAAIAIAL